VGRGDHLHRPRQEKVADAPFEGHTEHGRRHSWRGRRQLVEEQVAGHGLVQPFRPGGWLDPHPLVGDHWQTSEVAWLTQRTYDDLAREIVRRGGGLDQGRLASAGIAPQADGDAGTTGGAEHGYESGAGHEIPPHSIPCSSREPVIRSAMEVIATDNWESRMLFISDIVPPHQ
jgi:hypothetical protein